MQQLQLQQPPPQTQPQQLQQMAMLPVQQAGMFFAVPCMPMGMGMLPMVMSTLGLHDRRSFTLQLFHASTPSRMYCVLVACQFLSGQGPTELRHRRNKRLVLQWAWHIASIRSLSDTSGHVGWDFKCCVPRKNSSMGVMSADARTFTKKYNKGILPSGPHLLQAVTSAKACTG